jgi:hypothetical protein
MIIGYIATHNDDYNVGETYKVKGLPKVESEYGYMVYCSLALAIMMYGMVKETRIYEAEILGATEKESFGRYVRTNKMKVIREITTDELLESDDDEYAKVLAYIREPERPGMIEYLNEIVRPTMSYTLSMAVWRLTGTRYFEVFKRSRYDLIRELVAQYGTRSQRWYLINDEDADVRDAVAMYGDNSHREALLHDRDDNVRESVARFGTDKLRTELLDDDDWNVCFTIIMFGNDKHREYYLDRIFNNTWTWNFVYENSGKRLQNKMDKMRKERNGE